jgi:hypothetical protein
MISFISLDHEDTYSLGLLVENGLGLTSVTALFSWVVSTSPLGMMCSSQISPKSFLPIGTYVHVQLRPLVPTPSKIDPLTVISSLSLGSQRVLSLLVLSDLVGGVLLADLSLAVYFISRVPIPPFQRERTGSSSPVKR